MTTQSFYKKLSLLVLALLVSLGSFTSLAPSHVDAISGSDFNAARIIDDNVFFNKNTMGPNEIQAFLNSKVPTCRQGYTCLKDYTQAFDSIPADAYCGAVTGGTMSAAQIIFTMAQACGINPQALIVLLQKEQAIVLDDWPTDYQYTYATGFCVPDGPPPPACAGTYGFANQMYYGSRQFKKYVQLPQSFNFAAGRTSFINYSPNASCGGTNVTIHNPATAALYNYTPYQPNPGALANLYGTANCGAYGNRNFWRMFNDWFGPSTGSGYVVAMADNGDTRQWVLQAGKKFLIPNPEMVRAYGLGGPTVYPGTYLGSFPDGQTLTRLMRPAGTLSVYFVDGGKKFRIQNTEMINAWNLGNTPIIDAVSGLANLQQDQGDMTYTVRPASDSRVFLMDGGGLRHIQNGETLEAWEGVGTPVTTISDEYSSTLAQGTPLSSPRVSDGSGNQFIVSNRVKYSLNGLTSALYPWAPQPVSIPTMQRMDTKVAQPFARSDDDVKVYLIDQQVKHHIIDPSVLSAWQSNTQSTDVSVFSRGVINLLTSGSQLTDYYASNGGSTYLINRTKRSVPAQLVSAYTGTRTVYAASTGLLGTFSDGVPVTGFVRPAGQPDVYLLTNSGNLRHITSPEKLHLWAGSQSVTELWASNIGRYTKAGGIGAFVTDGTSEFVMAGGVKSPVSAPVKSNWKLSNPDPVTDGTLASFNTAAALPNEIQNSGQFYKINNGLSYGTTDSRIADMWAISSAPTTDLTLLREFTVPQMMTRFAVSNLPNDSRLFVVDGGVLYHLTPEQASNLGASGPFMYVNPESISSQPISLWGGILVKNASGEHFVIDGGGKRFFANSIIKDQWVHSASQIPVVSNGFLNTLPTKGPIERAIKGTAPSVYLAESVTKRWVRSTNTYNSLYAPYGNVSDALIRVLPNGPDIP